MVSITFTMDTQPELTQEFLDPFPLLLPPKQQVPKPLHFAVMEKSINSPVKLVISELELTQTGIKAAVIDELVSLLPFGDLAPTPLLFLVVSSPNVNSSVTRELVSRVPREPLGDARKHEDSEGKIIIQKLFTTALPQIFALGWVSFGVFAAKLQIY